MREAYEYNSTIYLNAEDLDQAIEEEIAHNYNNAVGLEEAIAREYGHSVDELNADSWETFKMWCSQEGLKPSHASSVERYYKGVKS